MGTIITLSVLYGCVIWVCYVGFISGRLYRGVYIGVPFYDVNIMMQILRDPVSLQNSNFLTASFNLL